MVQAKTAVAKKKTTSRAGKKKSSSKAAGNAQASISEVAASKKAKTGATERSAGRSTTTPQTRSKTTKGSGSSAVTAKAPRKRSAKATAGLIKKASSMGKAKGGNGQVPDRPVKLRKTRLSAEALDEFRQLLLDKRRELVGDVTQLESQVMGRNGPGGGSGSSSMPIHMADLGSDTWEQELTLGLIENERTLLREIDEALDRIEGKTYGICLATNRPITKSRLRAKPWAKYCIEYARKRELGLV